MSDADSRRDRPPIPDWLFRWVINGIMSLVLRSSIDGLVPMHSSSCSSEATSPETFAAGWFPEDDGFNSLEGWPAGRTVPSCT